MNYFDILFAIMIDYLDFFIDNLKLIIFVLKYSLFFIIKRINLIIFKLLVFFYFLDYSIFLFLKVPTDYSFILKSFILF